MKKVCTLLSLLLVTGCQQVPQLPAKAPTFLPKYHVSAPVALFATFPSDTLQARCNQVDEDKTCKEDAIGGNLFASVLKEKNWFDDVLTDSNAADYELLIASLAADVAADDSIFSSTRPHYFTELTVQWRGVEIDTQQFATFSETDKSETAITEEILNNWWLAAIDKKVFSAEFLFASLGASDYHNDLVLPDAIGEFQQQDTQYYPDPFKGIISRYVHPEYDDALIDITVGPILMPLNITRDKRLKAALEENLAEAQQIAAAQKLTLTTDTPVEAYSVNTGKIEFSGYRMAVHAQTEMGEPIFATTYVFEMKDKLVTLSTTFPPRVADTLIAAALPAIEVPEESALMKTIRGMSSAQ